MLSIHCFFFFKQKTAYEMRISDWSSDVCSSDLGSNERGNRIARQPQEQCLAVSPRHQGFPGPQRNPPEIDRSPSHFKRGLDQIMIPHRRSTRGYTDVRSLSSPKDRKCVGRGTSVSLRLDQGSDRTVRKKKP